MVEPKYIIISKIDPELTWSNSEGFTLGDDFEVFTEDERDREELPLDGEWAELVVAI
jgi:hypothetical protein